MNHWPSSLLVAKTTSLCGIVLNILIDTKHSSESKINDIVKIPLGKFWSPSPHPLLVCH